MIKNKKGQVSVEMIVVVGFLILLAVLLAALFLGFSIRSTDTGSELEAQQDEILDDFVRSVNNNQVEDIQAISVNLIFFKV